MSDIVAYIQYDDAITSVSGSNDVTVTSVGIQGLSATDVGISNMGDVDATSLENGSVLVYKTNTSKWTSTRLLDQQYMEGGEF